MEKEDLYHMDVGGKYYAIHNIYEILLRETEKSKQNVLQVVSAI